MFGIVNNYSLLLRTPGKALRGAALVTNCTLSHEVSAVRPGLLGASSGCYLGLRRDYGEIGKRKPIGELAEHLVLVRIIAVAKS